MELDVGCFGGVVSPSAACSGVPGPVVGVPMVLGIGSTGLSSSGGWCTGLLGEWECLGRK